MSSPNIRVMPSAGPKKWSDPQFGESGEYSTPCPACGGDIKQGDAITHTGRQWAHAKCVTDWLIKEPAETAWLVLGSQLARRPRNFSAVDTTTIVGQILRMAGGMPPAPWEPDHVDYEEFAERNRHAGEVF